MAEYIFFDRDLSWLSFNERILMEAAKPAVPLIERIKFLAIYSSNLDEFYRVRIPALMLPKKILKVKGHNNFYTEPAQLYKEITDTVGAHLQHYGNILTQQIIPELKQHQIHFVYKENIPQQLKGDVQEYFFSQVLAFIQPVYLSKQKDFFPENNKLYLAVIASDENAAHEIAVVNIPSDSLPRFFTVKKEGITYVVFIDDIIRENLSCIIPGKKITGAYSIKITRDAELELRDEYEGDIAEKIEEQISKRDMRFGTRFLYQPGIPFISLQLLINNFGMQGASVVEGGVYHNLKDLFSFPVKDATLLYKPMQPISPAQSSSTELMKDIAEKDIILHPPYQSYNTVLRFFAEAAIHPGVTEIYTTMYRVAGDSKIANALISAAKNGKKVSVFVELKARFDEANNLKWSKQMKAAGVKIIYSIPLLKVHAKVALVKKKTHERIAYTGLLATGNLNETTAAFYTDHVLLTAHKEMLRELELLFIFLAKRRKPVNAGEINFQHLLVAQFNLQAKFLRLINREIENAKQGLPASITIKMNNMEDRVLISKLYDASNAGVKIHLLIRSICCIVPGVEGQSENITVTRIVDRFLEHGRIFIFHNNGNAEVFLGSADWMNRNVYRRIEVCFPVYDAAIRQEIMDIAALQILDEKQAVKINSNLQNVLQDEHNGHPASQESIYKYLLTQKSVPQRR